ncbi:2-nitropropane dioxygenase [Formosimonas limnophila]|uniref:2-nitropropane dioxygenase n=1 Tax=Formosimonas limnophila TaxID=1384487 RepID=A0A8J3CNC1_9BURK|nr:nitronate monooxygenase family protein [Formosimonas limnophila]GHA75108.1 2-nitropropane dioxygenase [Formosimonas limnophila]
MTLPASLQNLRLPVICAPMFIVSSPALVTAQCKAGIVGSFPALNARGEGALDQWLTQLKADLAADKAAGDNPAPFAVNQIVHASNARLAEDITVCLKHQVPIFITSLQAPPKELIDGAHAYGGIVLHDVINVRHAKKALEAGVDGLILVAAGAGGHAGMLSPFALVGEIRKFYDGLIVLSGSIAQGDAILAAQAIGADLAYMGTRFIATLEANADESYKQGIIDAAANDVIYTNLFTGVHGNYLRSSIVNAGLDPDNLPVADKSKMNFGSGGNTAAKAWKDIWGVGQGVGLIDNAPSVAELVNQLQGEYEGARARLAL